MKKKMTGAAIGLLLLVVIATAVVYIPKWYDTIQKQKLKEISGKVVVFGDSIWGLDKGPQGIAAQLEELTSLQVTNYCLPGSTATRVEDSLQAKDSMVSMLLYNEDKKSNEIREKVREADYVFIEHAANDYFLGIPVSGEENSFEDSLRTSIAAVKDLNPSARIVLLAPTECYLIPLDAFATENDFGGGTLADYSQLIKTVATEEQLLCIDMIHAWKLTRENYKEYLVDGAHITKEARLIYSEYLAKQLYRHFYK